MRTTSLALCVALLIGLGGCADNKGSTPDAFGKFLASNLDVEILRAGQLQRGREIDLINAVGFLGERSGRL